MQTWKLRRQTIFFMWSYRFSINFIFMKNKTNNNWMIVLIFYNRFFTGFFVFRYLSEDFQHFINPAHSSGFCYLIRNVVMFRVGRDIIFAQKIYYSFERSFWVGLLMLLGLYDIYFWKKELTFVIFSHFVVYPTVRLFEICKFFYYPVNVNDCEHGFDV